MFCAFAHLLAVPLRCALAAILAAVLQPARPVLAFLLYFATILQTLASFCAFAHLLAVPLRPFLLRFYSQLVPSWHSCCYFVTILQALASFCAFAHLLAVPLRPFLLRFYSWLVSSGHTCCYFATILGVRKYDLAVRGWVPLYANASVEMKKGVS